MRGDTGWNDEREEGVVAGEAWWGTAPALPPHDPYQLQRLATARITNSRLRYNNRRTSRDPLRSGPGCYCAHLWEGVSNG